LAGVGAIASVLASLTIARHDGQNAARVPVLASQGIAWSAGVMLAFGAALRALSRDRQQGILTLVRARGASLEAYIRGRVGGLVLVLAATVGGATLVAALAATSAGAASPTTVARAGGAALAYALAFSATMGPIAMASLGGRTRTGGYLTLLAVLVLPELVSPWTSAVLPRDWHELTSIPAALDAVCAGVMGPAGAGVRAARALAGLGAMVALSLVIVAIRVGRADAEQPS
jgi:hypothetical protein